MADQKVTKSPKTPSRADETKPRSTPKSTRKRVVVDQFMVVPRDLNFSESNHNLPNGNRSSNKLPESKKQSKAARQLEMTEPSPPQPAPGSALAPGSTPAPGSTLRMPSAKSQRHFCDICKIYCSSLTSMTQHTAGRRHRIFSIHKEWDKLKANRKGVIITSPSASSPDDEKISVELTTGKRVIEFYITNSSESIVAFEHCDIVDLKSATRRRFTDFQLKNRPVQQPLLPNGQLTISLHCVKRAIGYYCAKVAFVFSDPKMTIVRDVEVQIVTQIMKELGPKAPYKHPPRVSVKMAPVKTVEGLRPQWDRSKDNLTQAVPLDRYDIPVEIRRAVNHGLQEEVESSEKTCSIRSRLTSSLCKNNYRNRFSLLLHIEELQMEVDIRKYDMLKVPLDICRENRKLLTLEVPGLSENRPSVLVGDHLFLRVLKSDDNPQETEYKAYVHRTCLNKVEIGLSENFKNTWLPKMKFNCRFNFNRLPIRLQHRAVLFAEENSLYDLLFPNVDNISRYGCIQPVDIPMKFYNRLIENNEQQESAVRHIVAGSSRPAPFLIFGPPGTGKTMTMVEAMKQVLKCIPLSKILACAPSNNAADLLAEKLLDHVPKESILRMNAASRDISHLPSKLKGCCNYNSGCYYPSVDDVMKLKIVVTTLVTAGRLVSANFPPGHFTHIFIDEAGQAVEPESIIPIAGIFESEVAKPDGGQVVLAGDPEQLGPVLRSPVAIKYGLDVSLLERYMKTDVYKRRPQCTSVSDAYDSRLLVKLIRNYRSHPDILKVPNELFYLSELEACADVLVRESLCQWSELPKKDIPVIFHGVIGKDEREERSPSFFNTAEIAVVVDYVDKLLSTKSPKVLAKEIGIISPYRKQVQKFRQALKKDKPGRCDDITVGTVEEFQGQERRVIIISTVRSSTDFLPLDYGCKLGFLKNPKRFNVSITRAKALLIVVGNPHILCRDVHWNNLLKFCVERGVYTGCEFSNPTLETDDELEECMEDLGKLQLSDTESPLPISSVTQLVEPEWRGGL